MKQRFNCLYVGEYNKLKIVGFKSQFTHSYGDNKKYFMKTIRGSGLNPHEEKEGIKMNNFYATYVIGPILVLNPYFTKFLLDSMGLKKYKMPFKKEMIEAYDARLKQYLEPDRGIYYI